MVAEFKILFVEHDPNDLELIERELKKGGLTHISKVVESEADYVNALKDFIPDVILSDFSLPDFDGPSAFDIKEKLSPETPFIFVSGHIGEEISVEFIKKGVTDYVLKDKLFTLTTKVRRALEESEERRQKKIAEQARIQSEKQHEEKLVKINRLNAFIGQINQKIVRVADEKALFHNACEIACDFGKFKMAWIGIFDVFEKNITLIEQRGVPEQDIAAFINAPCESGGPQDHVLRTGTYFVCNNIQCDLQLPNWRLFAAERDLHSCVMLPISRSGDIIGTFNLYSTEPGFFDKEELALLEEVATDISFALDLFEKAKKHRETEELLVKNEKQFRHTLDTMFEGIQIHDFDWRYIYVNDALVRYSTFSREELIGFTLMEKYPGVEQSPVFDAMQRTMKNRISEHLESEFNFPDGSKAFFELSIDPIPEGIFVLSVDRSEQKKAKEKEDFDRNNLKALINNTDDMIWSVDRDFNLITSNNAFDEMVKLMSGSPITKGTAVLDVLFSEAQLNRFRSNYERAFSGETFTEIEHAPLPIDIWSEISYYPIYKETTIVGTACFSRNITAQKKAENHLLLLESVVTNTADAVLITEADPINMPGPRIVYVNQAFTKMTGYVEGEVLGKTPRLLQGANTDRHQLDMIRHALINRQNIEVELINYKKNGEEFFNNFAIVPVTDKDGVLTHCVSVQRDVTSRRRSEKIALQRLERLVQERTSELHEALKKEKDLVELKNKFVSIASHEFRTPLSTISLAAESIRNYFHKLTSEEIQRKLIKIEDQASHMTNLLEDILTLGKSEAGKIKVKRVSLDLKVFIDTLIEEVRATVKDKREINFTFSCVSHKANADDKLLRNVINNLLTNALKFSGADKPVDITVSDFNEGILIEVADRGIGIEESELGSVFESFQRGSNASAVQGTGLGLSILKKAVELMNGSIEVKSKVNEGTTFSVQIPIK